MFALLKERQKGVEDTTTFDDPRSWAMEIDENCRVHVSLLRHNQDQNVNS